MQRGTESAVDVSDPTRPRVIFCVPEPEGGFCERGLRFGPHNLHENRPGNYRSEQLVLLTYFNAGARVYDLADAEHLVEVAHWLPDWLPETPRVKRRRRGAISTSRSQVWVTDRIGGEMYSLEPEPAPAELMQAAGLSD